MTEADNSSSPSRLRARLQGAQSEAVLQRAAELSMHLSNNGRDATGLVAGDNNALSFLLQMPGCPKVDLNAASAEDFQKQIAEAAGYCRDLMPAAKYLAVFPTLVTLAGRTDDVLEEFKAKVAEAMESTPFDLSQLTNGRSVLSHTYNVAVAKWMLEQESVKASLATQDNLLSCMMYGGRLPEEVVLDALNKGAPVTNDESQTSETALGLAATSPNYSPDLLKALLAKSTPEQMNFVRNSYGRTAADQAAYNGRWNIVRLFLEAGADLCAGGWTGSSAFNQLINTGDVEVIKSTLQGYEKIVVDLEPFSYCSGNLYYLSNLQPIVLDYFKEIGATLTPSPEDLSAKGRTPAQFAFAGSSPALCQRLIELGADAKLVFGGQTLLHVTPYDDLIQFLLQQGVDAKAVAGDGNTALHYAVQRASESQVAIFIAHCDVAAQNNNGDTALAIAVRSNYSSIARLLAAAPGAAATLSLVDSSGYTPLLAAAAYGYVDSARAIFEAAGESGPALLAAKSTSGQSVLEVSVVTGSVTTVNWLLEQKVSAKPEDNNGVNVLLYAVAYWDTATIDALLSAGASLNVKDSNDATFLQCFVQSSSYFNLETFKKLVEGTTDPFAIRSTDKNTVIGLLIENRNAHSDFQAALDFAVEKGARLDLEEHAPGTVVMSCVRNAGNTGNSVLLDLAKRVLEMVKARGGDEAVLQYLLAMPVDDTALHYGAYRGSEESDAYNQIFGVILEYGGKAAVNALHPTSKRTPFHVAAAGNNPGGARMLMALGADVTITDKDGVAPIDTVTSTSILQALIDAGAKITEKINLSNFNDEMIAILGSQLDGIAPQVGVVIAAIERYTTEDSWMVRTATRYIDEKLVDINAEVSGQTALHRLSYAGNNSGDNQYLWIQKLLAGGAQVNKLRSDGVTPLLEALRGSNRGALELLLAHAEIDVNLIAGGETALTYAATNGKAEDMVRTLLEKGADKKKANEAGKFAWELTSDQTLIDLLKFEASP